LASDELKMPLPSPLITVPKTTTYLWRSQPAAGFDEDTGWDLAIYPPSRPFDHLHMRLELDIPDMREAYLTGTELLRLRATGQARNEVVLDAADMVIDSVTIGGAPVEHELSDGLLTVRFDPPVARDEETELLIRYTLDHRDKDWSEMRRRSGLAWSLGNPEADNATGLAPQIHSQGQPQFNSRWFVCHDFPNERLTTELLVTVDAGFLVSSNGRLVDRALVEDGRVRWHWLQDKPHAPYLVSLIIGKFDVVNVGGSGSARPGLPMPVYVPIGRGHDAADLFANTAEMVAVFEEAFDEPYPWARYAQLTVRDFGGGMENTSATTLGEGSLRGRRGGLDGLIAHELAHQWFGDLVTCRSWEHVWLNEGWATYSEGLWAEHAEGRDGYMSRVRRWARSRQAGYGTQWPEDSAMVCNVYSNAWEPFGRRNNPYTRGALVLHMLRERLGDEVFFEGARLFLDRFKFRAAETDEFRQVLEEVSGHDLERFFDQWVLRPGLPELEIDLEWEGPKDGSGSLRVTVDQTQHIDAENPAFAFRLPLQLSYEDGESRYVHLDTETGHSVASFALDAAPSEVVIDPRITVGARTEIRTPLWPEPETDAAEGVEGGDNDG
jgi:aminopeptidase N